MSKKNYSKMFDAEHTEEVIETVEHFEEVVEEVAEMAEVEITPEPEPEPVNTFKYGVVVNCAKLNIRQEPEADAEVVKIVNKGSDLLIDEFKSTDDFYWVCTESGVEGFCMKKFIAIQ